MEMKKTYNPTLETKLLLAQALAAIKSVDYPVSLRWVYYRMVQDYGYPKTSKFYESLRGHITNARKDMYEGWMPYTLADESRDIYYPEAYGVTEQSWINSISEKQCLLDKGNSPRVIVMFEARAMYRQFSKYTSQYYVTLIPFAGDPSLDLKWDIAKLLSNCVKEAAKNGKVNEEHLPVVLYFGDYDKKGFQIPNSAKEDIEAWVNYMIKLEDGSVPFQWIRCGLNTEQIEEFNLPTDPEKENRYQWEALTDNQAQIIIEGALNTYIDLDRIQEVEQREQELTGSFINHMKAWAPSIGLAKGGETHE